MRGLWKVTRRDKRLNIKAIIAITTSPGQLGVDEFLAVGNPCVQHFAQESVFPEQAPALCQ
jgi:hypothetical protein